MMRHTGVVSHLVQSLTRSSRRRSLSFDQSPCGHRGKSPEIVGDGSRTFGRSLCGHRGKFGGPQEARRWPFDQSLCGHRGK